MQTLRDTKRKQVLICGIESHICVYQTTMGLLDLGYEVHVIADVVSSRSPQNRDIALMRMQSEGARITNTEMLIYEILKTAENPAFKEILKVIK